MLLKIMINNRNYKYFFWKDYKNIVSGVPFLKQGCLELEKTKRLPRKLYHLIPLSFYERKRHLFKIMMLL